MSFEYYYITVVGLVIFIVAIVIALVMNERYFRLIKSYLSQTKEAEAHGGGQALSGEVEVLMCPRCGFTKTIPFRLGDYVGKVTVLGNFKQVHLASPHCWHLRLCSFTHHHPQ